MITHRPRHRWARLPPANISPRPVRSSAHFSRSHSLVAEYGSRVSGLSRRAALRRLTTHPSSGEDWVDSSNSL
eukprot:856203-Prorocentrum_minimum.AAC.1